MFLKRGVLKVDGKPVSVGEVLAAACLNGWLADFRALLAGRLACAALAEQENVALSEEQVQNAVDDWRAQFDLNSAEETEAWLDKRGLDLNELAEFSERKALAQFLQPRIADAQAIWLQRPDAQQLLEAQLPAELEFEGALDPLLDRYALMAAVPPLSGIQFSEESDFASQAARYEVNPSRARMLLEMKAGFTQWRQAHITPDALARELKSRKQDLRWYDLYVATFPTADVAREALCCVTEESVSLDVIASRAETPCARQRLYFDALAALPAGSKVASAREYELIGPQAFNNGFLIYQLIARGEADLTDEHCRKRLEGDLIRRVIGADLNRRIQWI